MPEVWLAKPGQPAGKVIGSIGARGLFSNRHVLLFRPVGSKETHILSIGQFIWRGNVNDRIYFENHGGGEFGEVFHIDLPAGEFEIFEVQHSCDMGCGSDAYFASKPAFSVPFRVVSGEVLYLGRFLAVSRAVPGSPRRKSVFPRDMQFAIVDALHLDLKHYEDATGKRVDRAKVRRGIPDPATVALPHFRLLDEQDVAPMLKAEEPIKGR
ncbi:MAG: hypothetical protein ACT4P9_12795 [Betaproteobacteria bacterium]